jgi:dCTP deaminase
MIMTDGEIKAALKAGDLKINDFSEECLEGAGYDARIGKHLQRAGDPKEFDLESEGSAEIRAGEFFLFTTREGFALPQNMSAHLGPKSYFTYRGLVLLCGQHIDPGFSGTLVLGGYNASPRSVVVEFEERICNVEFHRLSRAVERPPREYPNHAQGHLPREVKDYIRGLTGAPLYELTQTVSGLASSVQTLSTNVQTLSTVTYKVVLPILGSIFAGMVLTLLSVWLKH